MFRFFLILLLSFSAFCPSAFLSAASPLAPGQPLILGANANESPTNLDPVLLERTQTTWVRAFFPASHFIEGKTSLATDDQVLAFKKLGDLGYHLFLTIKWDNRKDYASTVERRVPAPDSPEEKRAFAFASQLLNTFKGHVSGMELVNELTVDTHPDDLKPDSEGVIPMLRFLQRLAAFLTAEKHLSRDGTPLPLYAGGFTRMDQEKMQNNPSLHAIMRWLSDSPLIFGVNFHTHQHDYAQFAESLAYVRRQIPKKPFAITEFSLVWKYKAHLGEKLSEGQNAAAFCKKYQRNPKHTVADYLSAASADPVSQDEWHAFLATREWFDPAFLTKTTTLMAQHGVTLATYGFSHGPRKPNARQRKITTDYTPWGLNMIFPYSWVRPQPDGAAPVTYGFYDDWLALQKRTAAARLETQK
jgi:hypothetical protein